MKLIRTRIVKTFNEEHQKFDNDDPVNSIITILFNNTNIDIMIFFIISFFFLISKGRIDDKFYEVSPINFIFFAQLIFFFSFLLLLLKVVGVSFIIIENYLRNINKPSYFSPRNSLENNRNSLNNVRKSSGQMRQNIEMVEIDNDKSTKKIKCSFIKFNNYNI